MTTLTLKELDALKLKIREYVPASGFLDDLLDMASLAREALLAREQEPYGWHYHNKAGVSVFHLPGAKTLLADIETAEEYPMAHFVVPLYAAPRFEETISHSEKPQGKDSNHER